MVIPNKVSAVLDVICIRWIDTTSGVLVLSNRWHSTGLGFVWLLSNQLKTFVKTKVFNSEMLVGMSRKGVCRQHSLQYHFLCIHKIGQSY